MLSPQSPILLISFASLSFSDTDALQIATSRKTSMSTKMLPLFLLPYLRLLSDKRLALVPLALRAMCHSIHYHHLPSL